MDKALAASIIVVVVVVILSLMVLSWRRRARAQSHLPAPAAMPADLGTVLGEFEGLYLATTPTDDRLNRITVHGLGFRQRGSVVVTERGFGVLGTTFIPLDAVTSVGRASWTIDRGVEPDGLSVISWRLGDAQLDSSFRLADPEGFLTVATSLIQQTGQK